MIRCTPAVILVCQSLVCIAPSEASVVEFTSKPSWQNAVNNDYQTIHFTEIPAGSFINSQYSNVGVTFTDGDDFIHTSSSFPNDGVGCNGNSFGNDLITVSFAAQQHWIAADFPGGLSYRLYQGNSLIYTSTEGGGSGPGHFFGLVSTEWFDRAVLIDITGGTVIDDLHYNAAPAPGALAALGIGCLLIRSRRRPNR